MPVDKSRYPKNWNEISLAIRERDGWKCTKCGVKHNERIIRSDVDKSKYIIYNREKDWHETVDGNPMRMSEIPSEYWGKTTTVILTVHHIGVPYPDGRAGDKHDKMDCRPENLTSLCQRCHFIEDLDSHIIHAQESRKAKRLKKAVAQKESEGQKSLFGE